MWSLICQRSQTDICYKTWKLPEDFDLNTIHFDWYEIELKVINFYNGEKWNILRRIIVYDSVDAKNQHCRDSLHQKFTIEFISSPNTFFILHILQFHFANIHFLLNFIVISFVIDITKYQKSQKIFMLP